MKMKNVINVLTSIIIVAILTFAFASCGSTNTEDETASLSTTEEAVTDEVVKPTKPTTTEKEEATTKAPSTTKAPTTTKAPETTKPTEKPTETPTQEPTEAPETQPSGGGTGGGLDMSDAGKGPNTDHVGGESSDELHESADKVIEENGWDMDWELN